MKRQEKIPQLILDELDVNKKEEKQAVFDVKPIVEKHQIKFPLPRKVTRMYDFDIKKGDVVKMVVDEEKGEVTYRIGK
ncbi:MAG: hypothetical protein PF542_02175 [Nanoarchaeota archaeon]|nr:hypothetical protein [Nanoarchaeota archaeon]